MFSYAHPVRGCAHIIDEHPSDAHLLGWLVISQILFVVCQFVLSLIHPVAIDKVGQAMGYSYLVLSVFLVPLMIYVLAAVFTWLLPQNTRQLYNSRAALIWASVLYTPCALVARIASGFGVSWGFVIEAVGVLFFITALKGAYPEQSWQRLVGSLVGAVLIITSPVLLVTLIAS